MENFSVYQLENRLTIRKKMASNGTKFRLTEIPTDTKNPTDLHHDYLKS